MRDPQDILHATTVAVAGQAVLIIGPSGSGKSSLALQLMALGAGLVADDRTAVCRDKARIIADVPETIVGRIEARGVGILNVPSAGPTPLSLVVDMGQRETERLPKTHVYEVLGIELPCIHNPDTAHFSSTILLYMRAEAEK